MLIRTHFAWNVIPKLGVKKPDGWQVLSSSCSSAPTLPAIREQPPQEQTPGGWSMAGQPGPCTRCLATRAWGCWHVGGEQLHAHPPTTGINSLTRGGGSWPGAVPLAPASWCRGEKLHLSSPFMRAGGEAFHGASLRPLRGKFLAAEFMSCTFIWFGFWLIFFLLLSAWQYEGRRMQPL